MRDVNGTGFRGNRNGGFRAASSSPLGVAGRPPSNPSLRDRCQQAPHFVREIPGVRRCGTTINAPSASSRAIGFVPGLANRSLARRPTNDPTVGEVAVMRRSQLSIDLMTNDPRPEVHIGNVGVARCWPEPVHAAPRGRCCLSPDARSGQRAGEDSCADPAARSKASQGGWPSEKWFCFSRA